jgi:hypothetical protein
MERKHSIRRVGPLAYSIALVAMLSACGGGPVTPPTTLPTPPPTPASTIAAAGAGLLVIHPSLDSRLTFAFESPIRITESTGGTADWNFARMEMFRKGTKIEVYELGADVIDRAGFKRVAANSNKTYTVAFRTNQDDFDDIIMTLGFSDLKDGRQFTVQVPLSSFAGVDISIIPLSVPDHGVVRPD